LVELFDKTFGTTDQISMDLNTFKSKYYQAMHVREKVKKEAHALTILKDIMAKCEPNQIDNLFMLSVIMKEE